MALLDLILGYGRLQLIGGEPTIRGDLVTRDADHYDALVRCDGSYPLMARGHEVGP